jgi:type 1 glutamine amidotransferase
MLAYSVAKGYKHNSIEAGQKMLQDIGKEQGFEVTVAVDSPNDPYAKPNEDITAAGLAKYEIVFFMNPSGDVFNEVEQAAFEDWMTTKNGAFAGVHSATDTENGWSFYKEVTGQYNGMHDVCCAQASIQWQTDALSFVAVAGLPNPWVRSEEWIRFDEYQNWSTKAGFKILSLVTTSTGGTRPVSYVREWGNFRSFYTSLGHDPTTFQDEAVRHHIAAGIMWAVRREALFRRTEQRSALLAALPGQPCRAQRERLASCGPSR